jgi:hypothetical protein
MKRLFTLIVALLVSVYVAKDARSEPKEVHRLIVALYDGKEIKNPEFTRVHSIATMPLNHLGLIVRQYDVRKGLPPDDVLKKAFGVFTWFLSPAFKDPGPYLRWANKQIDAGKRFVMFGHPGVERSQLHSTLDRRQFDLLMRRIGVNWEDGWVGLTYDTRIVRVDRRLYEFERKLPLILPGYPLITPSSAKVRSLLVVTDKSSGRTSHLAVIGEKGGFVAPDYAVFLNERDGESRRAWYVNPFEFFRLAFKTEDLPKPDTTTMSGRRIYYSHIDGDAWHNISSVEAYIGKHVPSAQVAYEQVFKVYSDLPVTVGAVTGDIDPDWYGGKAAIKLARKIYALPNIEAGTHTHSHPFAWEFFHKLPPSAEIPYLKLYPVRPGKTLAQSVWDPKAVSGSHIFAKAKIKPKANAPYKLDTHYYSRPRAYAVKKFDLKDELIGSIQYLEKNILPPGKKVMVVQWSGDTDPWAAAVAMTRRAGVRNINGGDPRMDGNFKSYAWVSALARRVGNQWQVYSSGANENIYTHEWSEHYAAWRGVIDTFRNTESPIRIKPINTYYHFYTYERSDAFNALKIVLDWVRKQKIAPITTSRFASMVDGFLSARFIRLGKDRWRIEDRDGIETIRFDKATLKAVDFARSTGVIGQRWHQGSLYVALDDNVKAPVIAIREIDDAARRKQADRPYLIDARWSVRGLAWTDKAFRFRARGFGDGDFRWRVRAPGMYRIVATTADGDSETLTAKTGTNVLAFRLKTVDTKPRVFKVERIGDAS